MSEIPSAGIPSIPTEQSSLSLLQRLVAVYVRPAHAWGGLASRVQWWFPVLLVLLVGAVGALVLHDRALIPMLTSAWEDRVAEGQMSAEGMDQALAFMASPLGVAISTVQQLIVLVILTMVFGLVIWFALGFVLGGKIGFRLALEVSAWSSLVTIPATLVTYAVAWYRESYQGLHIGLGALLPEPETPSKLMVGLATFLDAFGPLQLWHLAVAILGASALSGTPVRRVGWTLGILYVVLYAVMAAVAALFGPGA